ncbi:hypothetical protein RUM43_004235 [Polyplax serrata]|uniref:Pyroglutamyl-peptidase I n=1 Tax=Polyplax serrata TaxID=468196 RepID=A0AAN8SAP5_POLSC
MNRKPGIPVVVTGFGPFGGHKVNASWEIAKTLPSFNLQSYGIELILQEIPVVYSIVNDTVPKLWKKHNPQLVIHMGLKSIGSEITLETVAHRNEYTKADVLGKLPENGSASGTHDVLHTGLNVSSVVDILSNSPTVDVPIQESTNAGRYLCEFTFYTSLNINKMRTIFVHVPNFDKGYSVQQLASVIKEIILLLLKQLL